MLIDNAHVESIIAMLHCDQLDGVHLKVTPPHMKTWSMSINDGKAALDTPPDGLIVTLLPSKSGTHNPLRPGNPAKFENPNSSSEVTPSLAPALAPASAPHLGPPMHPAFPQYVGLPYYYNPYPYIHPSLPTAPSPSRSTQFSDSIEEQDPLEQLIMYFAFLVARSPMQSAALNIAKGTLMEEGHTFKTLEKLSQADLEKAGIKAGMAMQLKSYTDLFKHKMMSHG